MVIIRLTFVLNRLRMEGKAYTTAVARHTPLKMMSRTPVLGAISRMKPRRKDALMMVNQEAPRFAAHRDVQVVFQPAGQTDVAIVSKIHRRFGPCRANGS